jgi:phosphatidylserine/phosphatidylglycerophosphate/cardiolipin synthase-like enzyme
MILPKTPDKGTFDANVDAMRLLLKPFFGQKKAIPNMRIYAYPGRIHAKLALFDNNQFMIGSANLTNGSLHLFRETNMIFTHCPMLIAQVQDQLKADCAKSTLLTHRTLPPYRRWLAKIQRLFI